MSQSSDNATHEARPGMTWEKLPELLSQPSRFFEAYLTVARQLTGASEAAILAQVSPSTADSKWRAIVFKPAKAHTFTQLDDETLETLGASAGRLDDTSDLVPLSLPAHSGCALAIQLPKSASGTEAVLALVLPESDEYRVERARNLLPLLASVPKWLEQQRQLKRAESDLGQLAAVLDLTVLLYSEERFHATAMLLCNEVASRYGCHRVSLGWLEGNNIQVRAISHTDKIEKRMESVQQLAAAMEEATDQGSEILYPAESDRFAVDRDHKIYASEQKLTQILTLPLLRTVSASTDSPDPDEAETAPLAGALTLEKDQGNFSEQEIRSLRLLCD
ncbi:MAG: hypothetical protein KDL87_07270, partial [Verrucomicrobiae bacterium]|nr:hypothetical protein [Verrucomicrobiae bacterium]